MQIDLHTHSGYSFDAKPCSVGDLCQAADDKHIAILAITDHKDFYYHHPAQALAIEDVQRDIRAAQKHWEGRVMVLSGIEIGEIHATPDADDFLRTYLFDQVIGSLHTMPPDDMDMYFMPFDKMDPDAFLHSYFSELLKMVQHGGFDVLAHIDYPLRVMKQPETRPSFANYMELISPVLQEIISRDIALEINAATLFSWQNKPGPEQFVLREYRRLGGTMISIGSDAHCAEDIGRGLAENIAYARQNGFDTVTIYEKRQPRQVSIS